MSARTNGTGGSSGAFVTSPTVTGAFSVAFCLRRYSGGAANFLGLVSQTGAIESPWFGTLPNDPGVVLSPIGGTNPLLVPDVTTGWASIAMSTTGSQFRAFALDYRGVLHTLIQSAPGLNNNPVQIGASNSGSNVGDSGVRFFKLWKTVKSDGFLIAQLLQGMPLDYQALSIQLDDSSPATMGRNIVGPALTKTGTHIAMMTEPQIPAIADRRLWRMLSSAAVSPGGFAPVPTQGLGPFTFGPNRQFQFQAGVPAPSQSSSAAPAGFAPDDAFTEGVLASGVAPSGIGVLYSFGSFVLSAATLPSGAPSLELFGAGEATPAISSATPRQERFGPFSAAPSIAPSGSATGEGEGALAATPSASGTTPPQELSGGLTAGAIVTGSATPQEAEGASSLAGVAAGSGAPSQEAEGAFVANSLVEIGPASIPTDERVGAGAMLASAAPSSTQTQEAHGAGSASSALFLTPAGTPTEERFGAPTGALSVAPAGVSAQESLGASAGAGRVSSAAQPQDALGAGSGTPSASSTINSDERLGAGVGGAVATSGVAPDERIGAHASGLRLAPAGAATGEVTGAFTVLQVSALSPTGFATQEAFGAASARASGAGTGILPAEAALGYLTAAVLGQGAPPQEAFGAPSLATVVGFFAQPSSAFTAEAFGAPALLGFVPPPLLGLRATTGQDLERRTTTTSIVVETRAGTARFTAAAGPPLVRVTRTKR